MQIINLSEEIKFNLTEVSKKLIFDAPSMRMALFCLEQGQEILPHQTSSNVSLYVVEGEGILTGEKENKNYVAGNLIFYKEKEPHGFKATKKSVILASITPRP